MSLIPGARLGPYEIVAPIGAGGMGEVYRAKDTKLDRDVAIKVLPESFALDADRVARFTREAKTLASLNHPNIAAIYGIEESGSTRALVMELVEGDDLSQVIGAAGPKGPALQTSGAPGLQARGMPLADALPIARQIAEALEAAHEQGIIHRDLKPANIKVRADGTVKVLDFGLAKAMDPAGASSDAAMNSPTMTARATETGMILGTAAYMSPEQAKGRAVDKRADIWAFGVVLYEMLTGARCFKGDDVSETMASVLKDTPDFSALPAATPPRLHRLLARCLERDIKMRLRDIGEARVEIVRIDAGAPDSSIAAPNSSAAAIASRRGVGVLAVAAVVVASLVMGTAAGFVTHDTIAPGPARVTEITYEAVTFDTGFVFAARFAKDPGTLVYSADWDGRPRDVFVTSLDTHEARPMGLVGADLLGLAPTGEMAILTGSRFEVGNPYTRIGTLARSTMMGGTPRAEDREIRFADLAPDGAVALVRRTASEWLLEFPAGHVLGRRPVGTNRLGSGGFVTPRVSPDGNYVATMAAAGLNGFKVQIYKRGGELVMEDTVILADWWGLGWRSSSEVWFAGAETSGNQTRIWALGLDRRRRLLFRAPGSITLHDVNGQGDVLASFDRGASHVELTTATGSARDLSWQDGATAVDLSNTGVALGELRGDSGGAAGAVVVWPAGAAQPIRISEGRAAALSLDGTTALVLLPSSTNPLRLVPVGPGRPRSLDVGPIDRLSWAGWLSDGRIALDVTLADGSQKTIVVSAAGGTAAPFLSAEYRLDGSRLASPDGRAVIARNRDNQLALCVLPAATCAPLAGAAPDDIMAGWTADSRSVLVFRNVTNSFDIQALDVVSGRRVAWKTVRTRQPTLGSSRRLIVSPNGDVVLGYDQNRSDLYVIKGLR